MASTLTVDWHGTSPDIVEIGPAGLRVGVVCDVDTTRDARRGGWLWCDDYGHSRKLLARRPSKDTTGETIAANFPENKT